MFTNAIVQCRYGVFLFRFRTREKNYQTTFEGKKKKSFSKGVKKNDIDTKLYLYTRLKWTAPLFSQSFTQHRHLNPEALQQHQQDRN